MSRSKLDANQIFQTAFDDATGSFKTIPSVGTSFAIQVDATDGDSVNTRAMAVDTTVALNAVAAGANANSADIDVLNYHNILFAITWASLTGTIDATVALNGSLDGISYFNISTITLSGANGANKIDAGGVNYKYVRLTYSHVSVTGGTVTAKYVIKG